MAGYRSLLEDPAQRRLLAASIPADFADWLDYVAIIAVIAFVWGHGAVALAFLALAFTLPYVTVGPFLAALVDRSDLKRVLVATNVSRAAATLAMAAAPNVEVLLILVLVRSTVDSAFNPARQAALQAITPEPTLMAANGLHQGVTQVSKLAGPAIGGALLLVVPAQGIFLLNGALSGLAVLLFLLVTLPARAPITPKRETIWGQFSAGFTEFLRNERMLTVLAFAAAANFTWFLYDTQIVLLIAKLGYQPAVLGISITFSGIGGLIAAALAGMIKPKRPLAMMAAPALVAGPMTVGLALAAIYDLAIPLWAFLVALGTMGGSTVFMLVPFRAVIQTETPPERIGRATAASEAVMIAAMMSAPFVGSAITLAFGTAAAFLAGGALLALLGVAALTWVALR